MKFNEKLLALRKKQGLSQEELGMELQVSRQTISKWESGQSYPDFQRLVLLSDYLGISLDELVKDIDVQDIREKNLTDEKVSSIYSDLENIKNLFGKCWKIINYTVIIMIIFTMLTFIAHLLFPDAEFLWRTY
ncbi:MAG: helix-turn-helix transcriptional regulator [Lachnospiraceae bacterium]|nr:helix-turn-helix transcriptional regulator [Lachnospiraceae bacterium]